MKKLYFLLSWILIANFSQAQTLNGITPNSGYAGQQNLNTTITGTNLFQVVLSPWGNIYDINLRQGANVIPVFDQSSGWATLNVNVIDPQNATAVFSIPSSSALGLYDLELTTTDPFQPGSNLQPYSVTGAFTVVAPDGYVSGKVYYDQNENGIFDVGELPLQSQSLTLLPINQSVLTDANGDYSIGLSNGNYSITYNMSSSHAYVISSDSASFSFTVNSANVSGLDFGMLDGITSISPAVAYQGQTINSNITSRLLFLAGGNPWGNIGSSFIRRTTVPTSQYSIGTNSFLVLDSTNAQLVYQIPVGAPIGTYDLVVRVNGVYYYLEDALIITAAPSYLSGNCYFDSNNNGAFDLGEPPIQNMRLYLDPDSSYAFSNSAGTFQFGASLGTHTLSYNAAGAPNFILTTQPSYTFTNTGNQSGFDFGFRSALPDYTCAVNYNPNFARCFSSVASQLSYSNSSNVVCQGRVYLIHSPNTTFSNSTPSISSQNGDTLFWDFTNLQPMEFRSISIVMVNPGSGQIHYSATLIVEDGLGIQQFQVTKDYSATVVCSYDPNDKAVFPAGVDDVMHYTLNSETLEYLIRFQNTGTDTAFTVYIRDTLDASLDISTLEVLASSHSVQTSVDSNRAVVFMFDNILLADSVVDEPNSHGYVRYRISPLPNLPDPTRIENTAYIYFDFNPAVVTNTTWNTMVLVIPVGISESVLVDDGIFFYPNPMDSKGYFSFKNPKTETMLLELFNVKGQMVSAMESDGTVIELNRKDLASGLYLFRLINTQSGKINSGKISIR